MTDDETTTSARARSTEAWSRAREVLAFGDHHRTLQRPLFAGEEDAYPRFAVEASGCRLVDERGRTYIDWSSGAGCALLGYRHPRVEAAIRAQLAAGPTLALHHPLEVELAQALTEMIPCAEMVGFAKCGSDSLTAAVRIARAHTGRKLILHCGYHGFHDWFACRLATRPGLPHESAVNLHAFPYGDLAALEEMLERFRGSVAAVLMEPISMVAPERGYLDAVRELAHAHGALLVFDEIWTWYRLGRGGAQEAFGVVPDLACYGKALGNGMPLAAIVGARRYMRLLPSVVFGATHRDETLSLAAAKAVLDVLRSEPVVEHLHSVGRRVRAGLLRFASEARVECDVVGLDARQKIEFPDQGGLRREHLLALFLRECASRGVLISGLIGANYAHDEAAVKQTLEVFAEAMRAVGAAVHSGSGAPLFRVEGQLDRAEVLPDGGAELMGWLIVDDGCATRVEVAAGGRELVARPFDRPDVVAALGLSQRALACGFTATLPAGSATGGELELEIRARAGDALVFRCAVTHRPGRPHPILGDTAWLTFGV